jgi:uncharacterized protein with von Willebrand factor type A (vWA) domain
MSQFRVDLGFQYKNLKNRSKTLKAIEAEAAAHGMKYSDLPSDFFNALFQQHPQLREMDQENLYNQIVRAVIQSPNFQRIRQQTKNSLHWSAVGASILLDEVTRQLSSDLQQEPEPEKSDTEESQEKPEENSEESNNQEEESDSQGNNEGDNEEPDESESSEGNSQSESEDNTGTDEDSASDENSDDSDDDLDEDNDSESGEEKYGKNKGSSTSDDLDSESDDGIPNNDDEDSGQSGESNWELDEEEEEIDNSDAPIDERIQAALDRASAKIDNMLRGLQQGEANTIAGLDEARITEQLAQLGRNRRLAEILELIGRLRLNNRFLAAMQVGEPEETVGVTQGREIKHTLPQDMALLLGNEQEFGMFARKFSNGELLQRQYKSNSRPGKGPMVVCIDHSGSMSGNKSQWANVISAAIYLQCLKERRAFAGVIFGSWAKLVQPIGKGLDASFLNTLINSDAGGGTDFDAAWNESTHFMRTQPNKSWKDADIVLITDGQCGFQKDRWLMDKAKYNIRLMTFMIGVSQEEADAIWTEAELKRIYRHRWEYHRNLLNQPKHQEFDELRQVSDSIVFVERLDENAEKQAFNLIKNNKQRLGQMVR